MMRSLFSGVSGIKVHQTRMDVIGNNIANINTIGFKGSRTTFSDMLSQLQSAAASATDTRGGINPRQVGLGVNVESIDLIFTDSSPQSTGKNTDLALAGNGLFYLRDGNQAYYTRNGSFLFDENGYYVMAGSGYRVQGWNASSDGVINNNGATTDIIVPIGKTMEATATTNIAYNGNLNKESQLIKSISYTASTDGEADETKVVARAYSTDVTITAPDGYTLSGTKSPLETINTRYANGDDVSGAITATYERGTQDAASGNYYYNIIYKDASGNTIATATSNTALENAPTGDPPVTAVAAADTSADSRVVSVNVDGENVVAATITYRDDTTMTITSGYYEVGKSVPITTIATVFDSLGGKHEVTLLIDKDPTSNDAALKNADASATARTTEYYTDTNNNTYTATLASDGVYTYTDADGATQYVGASDVTVTWFLTSNNNQAVLRDDNGFYYTDGDGTRVNVSADDVTENCFLTSNANQAVTAAAEGSVYQYTDGNGATQYVAAIDVRAKTVFDNRWRVYIAPGVGEQGPAIGDTFENTYIRSEATNNAEADGSSTRGAMNSAYDGSKITYLYFNDRGAFISNGRTEDAYVTFDYAEGNGAAENQAILDFTGLTQYANSTTSFPTSNGNTAGVLQSVAVDSTGIISGTYTNGLIRNEAQISVAQFTNNAGLNKVGTTIYTESNNSGAANIRTVQDFGLSVTSSALEMSNVDLATEFSEMIITQRGFQANSKMTTVSDEMLETLVNMKR